MPIDARSPNRNYPIPAAGNFVSEDFPRLTDALLAIDTDIAGLLTSVSGRALLSHTHTIANVTGLQAALDGKQSTSWRPAIGELTDVNTAGASNGQFLRLISGVWQPASIGGLDASAVTSGVFDPARIPVLTGQAPVVSSGGLGSLTAPQQAQIIVGTTVITTDGFRWVYAVNGGSKTDPASYIQLADITPEWTAVANKPSTFAPSAHSHPISDVTGLQAALDAKAALAANVFTGDQAIYKNTPISVLDKTAAGQFALIRSRTAGVLRWDVVLGDDSIPGGSNSGENFAIQRYSDAGAFLGYGIKIRRGDGYTEIPGSLEVGAPSGGNQLLVRRISDNTGGQLLLERPAVGSSLAANIVADLFGNGFRIYEAGGSTRGAYLNIALCNAGASTEITHTENIRSQLASISAGEIGSYAFMRDNTAGTNPNAFAAGSNLFYASSGNAGIVPGTGTWRCHGNTSANGQVTLFQRVS